MKDIKQLIFYIVLTVGVILGLIYLSRVDGVPSSLLVGTAVLFVVVLPVVLGIKASKREKERERAGLD